MRGEPKPPREREAGPRKRDSITISFEAREYLVALDVDPTVVPGAQRALFDCLGLRAGESIVIVVQTEHEEVGAALLRTAEAEGVGVTAFVVAGRHADNRAFVARLCGRVEEADGSCLVAGESGLPREFRERIKQAGRRNGRHAHMVGIRPEMLRTSVRADADEVRNLSARLQEKLSEQKRFRVETTVGTHLDVRLDPSRPWVVHDGRLRERGWVELPCGEVFTSPASVSGVLVPDGGFWLPDGTASPPTVRLRLRFEGGELARVEGVDAAAAQTLLDQLDSVPEGRRVGRVCFGTNTGVLAATGARLQDTKMPGFHLVLGDPIAELTAAPWQCESEAFVLARRADVVAAGGPLLVRGRYTHALRP